MALRNPSIEDIDESLNAGYFVFKADDTKFTHNNWRGSSFFYDTFEAAKVAAHTPHRQRYSLRYEAYEIWAFYVGKDINVPEFFPPFLAYVHTPAVKK